MKWLGPTFLKISTKLQYIRVDGTIILVQYIIIKPI